MIYLIEDNKQDLMSNWHILEPHLGTILTLITRPGILDDVKSSSKGVQIGFNSESLDYSNSFLIHYSYEDDDVKDFRKRFSLGMVPLQHVAIFSGGFDSTNERNTWGGKVTYYEVTRSDFYSRLGGYLESVSKGDINPRSLCYTVESDKYGLRNLINTELRANGFTDEVYEALTELGTLLGKPVPSKALMAGLTVKENIKLVKELING